MRKLTKPPVNDHSALELIANNKALKGYDDLNPVLADLLEAYDDYEALDGDALRIGALALSDGAVARLEELYKKPLAAISYITKMRELSGYKVCPMCGSTHSGTLDHLLPQDQHPAFSIFSPNLIPACKCNSLRQNNIVGPNPGERVLHPYFDQCLAERLVSARFTNIGKAPSVEVHVLVPNTRADYPMIDYHVRTVLKKTGINGFLREEWDKLLLDPSSFLSEFKNNPTSGQHLEALLREERGRLDRNHKSLNNWHSMYVTGLLDPPVTQWLYERFIDPARQSNTPLLPGLSTELWPAEEF